MERETDREERDRWRDRERQFGPLVGATSGTLVGGDNISAGGVVLAEEPGTRSEHMHTVARQEEEKRRKRVLNRCIIAVRDWVI